MDRRASFSFTTGSLSYGLFHYAYPQLISAASSYEILRYLLGVVGSKGFGVAFMVISTLKLIGLFTDNNALKLPMYFALLFMWALLSISFFIAFLQGHANSLWILTTVISLLSTTIITGNPLISRRAAGG